jgi:hypothetical protein
MMARDNPQGAAAMAQVPSMEARAWQPRFSNVGYNQATGQQIMMDQRTGQTYVNDLSKNQGFKPYIAMSDKARDEFNENDEHITQESTTNIPALRNIQMQLRNGEIDPSYLSHKLADIEQLANQGDEKARNLVQAEHWLSVYHSDLLKSHPGQQTDKDSENAFRTIMPGNSEYDAKSMSNAIDTIIQSSRTRLGSMIRQQNGAMNTYGNQIPMDTRERYQAYQNYQKGLDDLDNRWQGQREAWFKEPTTTTPPPAHEPKFSGSHSATGGEGSLPTATNPKGERVIYKDGKWQPLK